MNKILLFFILINFSLNLSAFQGVPNIILTDIQGNERNLYKNLDEGKVVIVDVFTTWCTTCWENHNNFAMQRLYNTYGPNGTQQLEIFFIEGDSETDLKEIYGDGSFGDWTEDQTYPIFSPTTLDYEFLKVFAPDGVPTSNVICPQNKDIIADIYQNNLSEIIDIIQRCNTISNVKDLQILKPLDSDLAICKPTDLVVDVLNTGTDPIKYLSLIATLEDGSVFKDHSCEVDLQPGFSHLFNMGEFEISDNVEIKTVNLNIGNIDDVASNNHENLIFKHAEPVTNKLTLRVKTDRWVEKDATRWWIENSAGDIVGSVNYLTNETEIIEEIAVENNDCFTFIIVDDYGDGFVLGEIELKTEEGNVIFDDTNFRYRGEANFEFLGSSTTTASVLDISKGYDLYLLSNLVKHELEAKILLPNLQNIQLHVIDLNGRIIISKNVTPSDTKFSHSLNVQVLQDGIYFLQLATEQGILTKKFIKH